MLKAGELISQFGTVDGYKVLYPSLGHLVSIACKIGLPNPSAPDIVYLYDDNIPLVRFDKKDLIKTINDLRQIDIGKGVAWQVPHQKDSLPLNLNFHRKLCATGNVEELIFWIKGSAVGGELSLI